MGTGWHVSHVQSHHTFWGTVCVWLTLKLVIDHKKEKGGKKKESFTDSERLSTAIPQNYTFKGEKEKYSASKSHPHMADWLFRDI